MNFLNFSILGKYTVPKGTNIVFFLYTSGRDPNIFPDPDKFDPDRFLGVKAENALLTWSFAEGARNCIGKYLKQGLMFINIE